MKLYKGVDYIKAWIKTSVGNPIEGKDVLIRVQHEGQPAFYSVAYLNGDTYYEDGELIAHEDNVTHWADINPPELPEEK